MKYLKRYSYDNSFRTVTDTPLFGLTPFCTLHVNPGETLRGHVGQFLRMQPFKAPILNRFYLHNWFFYIPYRLLDEEWENVVVDVLSKGDADFSKLKKGKIPKWLFGLGDDTPSSATDLQYPLLAYNLIWNHFFRDEEIFSIETEDKPSSGEADTRDDVPLNYQWNRKNTADNKKTRPWETKANLFQRGFVSMFKCPESTMMTEDICETEMEYPVKLESTSTSKTAVDRDEAVGVTAFVNHMMKHKRSDMREAFMLARRKNIDNVYGLEGYRDLINSIGGSVSREQVDQPEMLYHSSRMLLMDDVMASNGAATGEVAGYIIGTKRNRFPSRKFKEHGIVLGLMAIRPEMYYHGLVDQCVITPNNRSWWFGDSFPDTYKPVGKQLTKGPSAAPSFGRLEIEGAFRTSLDQFRNPGDQINPEVVVEQRADGQPWTPGKRGSFDPFMFFVEDCTSHRSLRDPCTLDKSKINGLTFSTVTTSQLGKEVDEDPSQVKSVALVKTDLKLQRITPIKPIKSIFLSNKMGG